MPRKWTGKWFTKSSGHKPTRKNGRGQPKRGGSQSSGGTFQQVRVDFTRVTPASMPSKVVVDTPPTPGKRRRTGRRRSSY